MKIEKNLLKSLVKSLLVFIAFCSLNSIKPYLPLSFALFSAFIGIGGNVFIAVPTFLISFVFTENLFLILSALIYTAVILLVKAFYLKRRRATFATVFLLSIAASIGYALLPVGIDIVHKLTYMAIIGIFSLVFREALHAISKRRLTMKKSFSEAFSLSVAFLFIIIGYLKLFGINWFKPIAFLAVACASKYYKNATALTVSSVIFAAFSNVTGKYEYFALGFALFFTGIAVTDKPCALTSTLYVITDFVFWIFTDVYDAYGYAEAIPTFLTLFGFAFVPNTFFAKLRDKSTFSTDECVTKSVIAKNRIEVSTKLYDVSNVFFQMQDAFLSLKSLSENTDSLIDKMTDEVILNACIGCNMRERCEKHNRPDVAELKKTVTLGINKGRVSLIDLPRDFTAVCAYPNSIIFEVNRLIGGYCELYKGAESMDKSKEILSLQSYGVGSVMKALAFSLSKSMPESTLLERKLYNAFSEYGIKHDGILCFGEDENIEITAVVENSENVSEKITLAVKSVTDKNFSVSSALGVSDKLTSYTLKPSPRFNAAFGVAKITKSSSSACGDCHSLIKIDENNFLVALSDGMGSGKIAETTSTATLNLIESFYKAGLKSELVLSLINKLLAVSIDDNFSAIDLALVNLSSGMTDFIKIGSPYGFILSGEGIRFIEGSSLPLGILDELHPTTASAPLFDGDVIVLVSDGVTDSFGSSSDFIDFLKTAPLKNPQDTADSIVRKAINLTNGIAEDDLTAVCVRIFSTAS